MSSGRRGTFDTFAQRYTSNYSSSGARAPPSSFPQARSNVNLTNGHASSAAPTNGGATIYQNRNNPPTGTIPDNYHFGQILNVPHPGLLSKETETDATLRVWTDRCGYVCPKMRYAIVVAVYPGNLVVLPIFSYAGHGAKSKDTNYQMTAISVWHPSQKNDPAVYNQLTPERLCPVGPMTLRGGSHVQLTQPLSIPYKTHITPYASLNEESKALLKRRYRTAVEMGFIKDTEKGPKRQANFFTNAVKKDSEVPAGDSRLARSMQNLNLSRSAAPSSVHGSVAHSRAPS